MRTRTPEEIDALVEQLKNAPNGQIVSMPRVSNTLVDDIAKLVRQRDRFERKLQRAVQTIKEQYAENEALRSRISALSTERDDLLRNVVLLGEKREHV